MHKLDSKDYDILRELDKDFRQSFSKIGKSVKLSKNSISLRFDKLQEYMLHNTTGINNKKLGYTDVRVYYEFDFLNESTEKAIVKELKKYKHVSWAARFYGVYDLGIGFWIKELDQFIEEMGRFNEKFANKIISKEIQIGYKQYHYRYNFIHKEPINNFQKIESKEDFVELTKVEKSILKMVRLNPRINLVDISSETGYSLKTISDKLKLLKEKGIITGYFMTLDPIKFNHNTFKLLIQLRNEKFDRELEEYLGTLKNVKIIFKMSGSWDYEIDFIYPSIRELQNEIENLKQKFPMVVRKFAILSFSRRILTNEYGFLVSD
jgi:DNA-binding Lrp family transcriptional regulator